MTEQFIALQGFEDSNLGSVRRGQQLQLNRYWAEPLRKAGLIRAKAQQDQRENSGGKASTAGAEQPSSASPAAPVLLQTTSSESGGGGRRKTKAVPSS